MTIEHGRRLRVYREGLNLTLSEAAKRLSVDLLTYLDYEQGKQSVDLEHAVTLLATPKERTTR